MIDANERARIGRIGGLMQMANNGSAKLSRQGVAGLLAKFAQQVDPEGLLSSQERAKRADFARRAYMAQLARKSAQKRGRAKERAQRKASGSSAGSKDNNGRAL